MNEKTFDPGAFATRLRDLIYPEKYAAFAQRSGISLTVLNKYMAGKEGTSPSIETIVRICQATQSSIDWLVLGEGDSPTKDESVVKIPVYDVYLSAGDGAFLENEKSIGDMPFTRDFLRQLGYASAEPLAIVHADGDSMEPVIHDRAPVMIDKKDTRLREGIFAFRLGDHLRVKRLRPTGLNAIEVLSANPAYPPEVLDGPILKQFAILGRAIWTGSEI